MFKTYQQIKKIFLLIFFIFLKITVFSQEINIGILTQYNFKKFDIEILKGRYEVFADGKSIMKMKNRETLQFKLVDNKILLFTKYEVIGRFNEINLKIRKQFLRNLLFRKQYFKIYPKGIWIKSRTYDDNLNISLKKGKILLINNVNFIKYIAGVVESEGGSKAHHEYYKSQAILCQTYALRNKNKHKTDGFNLCDGVHCQAYKGKNTYNKNIYKYTKRVKRKIVKDIDEKLIDAVFHANCGGETAKSEDVWLNALSYLKSVEDTFCTNTRQAKWEKVITLKEWKNFLLEKIILEKNKINEKDSTEKAKDSLIHAYFLPQKYSLNSIDLLTNHQKDSLLLENISFKQIHRKKYFTFFDEKIKLTKIRYFFKLRSTFFEIISKNNVLHFQGRGYGHGVGLCQEGAMEMAKQKYNYQKIINFYYQDTYFEQLKKSDFKFIENK